MDVSIFWVNIDTPTTSDIIYVECDIDSYRGLRFSGFSILPDTGTAGDRGRHGIYFNQSVATFNRVLIDNLTIRDIGEAATGKSIRIDNSHGNGGVAYSTVRDCYFDALWFSNVGDQINIVNTTIANATAARSTLGLYFYQVGGAAGFVVRGCDIACVGGGILCDSAISPTIAFNEFETQILTSTSEGATIQLDGNEAGEITNCLIIGNSMSSHAVSGDDNNIYVGKAHSTLIIGNRLAMDSTTKQIAISANAVDTHIGFNYCTNSVGTRTYAPTNDAGSHTTYEVTTGHRIISNTAATITGADRLVVSATALTAPRTFTLPLAAAVSPGVEIEIIDISTINGANTITVACAGADTFADGTTTKVLAVVRSCARIISLSGGIWFYVPFVVT